MLIIISYDIVKNRQRLRVAKLLSDYGQRVQKSVFECDISEGQFTQLRQKIEAIINRKDDSVRYYFLCGRCRQHIEVSGWGVSSAAEETVIV